jgi:hypothetical protein
LPQIFVARLFVLMIAQVCAANRPTKSKNQTDEGQRENVQRDDIDFFPDYHAIVSLGFDDRSRLARSLSK